ncbi:Six-hairpin glycosidase [Mollisia scopiformis]|uniref:Six-hairpin glycosidase n=1 Tax=Mollisia scopiformis TaxID=149040 RepID=A0A194X0G1_MOLSC|nr:Six-hairpin glycosidase [Mollisia scopiformis]KUJ13439.1 Six-hairpin glycosidase [Mollisia scopiformis]
MKKFIQDLRHKTTSGQVAHRSSAPKPDIHHTTTDIAKWIFEYFYSPANGQFQARAKSESTLGENDHFGYVVWPVIIMVQAAAECLSGAEIQTAVASLQTYWNPGRHGFCAWKMFPGNEDIYFDDNGHACQALISVFQATGQQQYLEQAKLILRSLIMPAAAQDGGVPWHTNNWNCRNACSTGPAAVAALRIYEIQRDEEFLVFAERALQWMVTNLRDADDGLIWDSFVFEADGNRNINKMKWTYNIGFAIHGFALLYSITKKREHLDTAIKFAEAAMNSNGSLFDRSIQRPEERMYSDASFFLHHLVDSYGALSQHTMKGRLSKEIARIADWGRMWVFDQEDGLYFRGSCPYTISEDLTKKFNKQYDLQKDLEPNGQERDEKGNLCKTLIGNAGWIRILKAAESQTLQRP